MPLSEGNLNPRLKTYVAPSVLVIDDVGLIPMDRGEAMAFFQHQPPLRVGTPPS